MNELSLLSHEDQRKKALEAITDILYEREVAIISRRFALEQPKVCTYKEISMEFQITRERVSLIELKALQHLLHPSVTRKYPWLVNVLAAQRLRTEVAARGV